MTIQNIICDIDGVLMHDNVAVPGAAEFIKRILDKGMPLVMLTNYPSQTGQDLANRFATAGIDVPDSAFYTSAMATADFLRRQEGKKSLRGGRRGADPRAVQSRLYHYRCEPGFCHRRGNSLL